MNTNKMIKPKNRQCRTRLSKLANRFIHTMNREKRASMIRMTIAGTPVQIRVLDSRSYFFMTASTSSAVPMAARVSQKVGQEEDPGNFLLMHAMGPNVSGVIGSAVAAGVFIALFA